MAATMITEESDSGFGDCTIADLSDDERLMLVEFAQSLYDHATRSLVARLALDRVAVELIRAAARTT